MFYFLIELSYDRFKLVLLDMFNAILHIILIPVSLQSIEIWSTFFQVLGGTLKNVFSFSSRNLLFIA